MPGPQIGGREDPEVKAGKLAVAATTLQVWNTNEPWPRWELSRLSRGFLVCPAVFFEAIDCSSLSRSFRYATTP
jgi:hypothetical protein